MDANTAARRWRDTWLRAWESRDVEAVRSLYAEDSSFRSHPFRVPHEGADGAADYARGAFEDEQGETRVWFGEPVVAGDRATCEYWAIVRYDGVEHTIAGVSLLRFADDGQVLSQRDYWVEDEGAREPHDGFER